MKRLITLLCIAVLVFAAFTGCKKDAKSVAVGAKNFTEQYILGNMISQLLQESGFKTKEQFGTGSSITRDGLTTGQISMYPEYTGTAWTVYLEHEEKVSDPQALYERVKQEDLENNGIVWLDRWDMNNTYALAIKQERISEIGTSISDLAEYMNNNPGKLTIATDQEFYERPDGFPALAQEYGMKYEEEQIKMMDIGLSYEALDRDQVDVAMVFATDGLLKKFNLKVLEDNEQFFPVYNVAVTIRKEVLDEFPEIEEILKPLAEIIDDETMQDLNYKVDAEGLPEKKVAVDFLKAEGLID
jgi:osmoprotectant transport system substrate-binding protein